MDAEAISLERVLSSIFRRKGGNGLYTGLFENLDPSQRSILLSAVALKNGELPIIGSVKDLTNWLLITTERLVWSAQKGRNELVLGQIRDAVADFQALDLGPETKAKMQELCLIAMNGIKYRIQLEPGRPLFGTWSVLKNVGARNRHSKKRKLDKQKV